MVSVSTLSDTPTEFVARTVNVAVPLAVGVPLMTPADDSDSPAGSAPA